MSVERRGIEGEKRSLLSLVSSLMTGQAVARLVRPVESWSVNCGTLVVILVGD